MLKVFMKFLYMPLSILACFAAGSVFLIQSSSLLVQAKFSYSSSVMNWFTFAVNASILTGIVPSKLYKRFGAKQTIFLGGILLGGAHVATAILINISSSSSSATTFLLFLIAIIGGQGACIIYLSAICYSIKYHSILCTHMITGTLFSYLFFSDPYFVALKLGTFSNLSLSGFFIFNAIFVGVVSVACAFIFTKKDKAAK